MVIGAIIASGDDLTFNWFGYTFLFINNICTAAQGVVIKQKLVNKVNLCYFYRRKSVLFYLGF
jgi:hypothetical protein